MKIKQHVLVMLAAAPLLSLSNCRKVPLKDQIMLRSAAKIYAPSGSKIPLNNMFGVDGYEWNFLMAPGSSDASVIYEPKMAAIKNFTAVRHYMDWEKIEPEKGKFTFNPTHAGSWNYDAIYQRAAADSILMLADLKSCPPWFLGENYAAADRDAEDVPANEYTDKSNPASYIEQAKAAFQFAARYGYNSAVDPALVTVDPSVRWNADPSNVVKIGLHLVNYIECDNERDKWWKGPKAQQSAQEYAANMSAFYDGNKGKLGVGVGVKNADPNMQVVMGGLASADVQFVKDMVDWCKTNRGYRADGSVDLCFDVINYHYYANAGDGRNTPLSIGLAPELSKGASIADDFVSYAKSLKKPIPVWLTETGYDSNPSSPQRAISIGDKSAALVQADWTIRTALMYIRHGIARNFFYQLYDDNAANSLQYASSGLINDDFSRRPVADYILQAKKLMGKYIYNSSLNTDPLVDKYTLGSKKFYVLTVPDQTGRTASYTLTLNSASADVYTLQPGADSMTKTTVKTTGGKLTLTVTETPIFVQPQ